MCVCKLRVIERVKLVFGEEKWFTNNDERGSKQAQTSW